MLFWFVGTYWLISVGIGLYSATRVHNTKDFAVAGRHLPFYMVTATVFATWFGSETVLGIPATFLKENLRGMVAGSLLPQFVPHDPQIHDQLRFGHHAHAANETHHVADTPHHH